MGKTSTLEIGPAMSEGPVEGDLIGLLDTASSRQSLGDTGDKNSGWGEHFGQVMGRRLPFDIGPKGENHLGGTLLPDTFHQFGDAKLLRADPVER